MCRVGACMVRCARVSKSLVRRSHPPITSLSALFRTFTAGWPERVCMGVRQENAGDEPTREGWRGGPRVCTTCGGACTKRCMWTRLDTVSSRATGSVGDRFRGKRDRCGPTCVWMCAYGRQTRARKERWRLCSSVKVLQLHHTPIEVDDLI